MSTTLKIDPLLSSALIWLKKAAGRKYPNISLYDTFSAASDGYRLHVANNISAELIVGNSTFANIALEKAHKGGEEIDVSYGDGIQKSTIISVVRDGCDPRALNFAFNPHYVIDALSGFLTPVRIRISASGEVDKDNNSMSIMEIFGTLESGEEGYAKIMGILPNTDTVLKVSDWKPTA